ncbi:MAG: hypothetical protein QXR53_00595 [Candidatus Norongarragalinales archaeon]
MAGEHIKNNAAVSFRRVFSLVFTVDAFSDLHEEIDFVDFVVLPLVTSALLFYAFWSIKREFDSAETAVENKVRRITRRL